MSYEIGTEKSYDVFKRRKRDGELSTPPLHQPHQVRHARLDDDEINTRFSTDEFAWERERKPMEDLGACGRGGRRRMFPSEI